MPRVNKVKKCRKSPGTCGKCGTKINVGEPYLYWAFMVGGRGGPKIIRCGNPACSPKPADLTQSDFLKALYDIQETNFEGSLEDMESQIEEVKGQLEELRDETEEKLNNMPEGLQQGDTGQMLQERVDGLNDAISELENVDLTFDEEEPSDEESKEHKEWAKKKEEREDEIAQECSDALNNISCG